MLITLSPAKTLDFENAAVPQKGYTEPEFLPEADYLAKKLKSYSVRRLKKMMGISQDLAELNFMRYQKWEVPLNVEQTRKAIEVFQGDAYRGLDYSTLSAKGKQYLSDSLYILSGLYGVLSATDVILPYRLEMGTSFKVTASKTNLYKYWNHKITDYFNQKLVEKRTSTLVNLASAEYFKVIQTRAIQGNIITPEFKDLKDGNYKMIGFFAKRARGMMVRFIAENQIQQPDDIKAFDREGYYYNSHQSTENKWVFTRDQSS
jgi:cytoplasmic iron level regulating protein YaaA (DUF328/UPF0246 family)